MLQAAEQKEALNFKSKSALGSGCGSVGRVVASDTRIQSSANFIYYQLYLNCIEETKMTEKRPGISHLKK